jgi:outer membrane protein assembly factor BamB
VTSAGVIDSDGIQKQDGELGGKAYRWEVSCVDLETGQEIWNRVAREGYPRVKKHAASNYACETPVTDGEHLYVYFGMHGVFCYTLEGDLKWGKDLGTYKTQMGWGTGSSPVLYEDLLFIQVDNDENPFLVAMDKETGEVRWRVERKGENTNYSTPYLWKNKLRHELIVGGERTISYEPLSGKVLWELETNGRNTIPSPVGDAERLFLGNAGFMKTPATLYCVKAGAEGDITPPAGDSISAGIQWSLSDAPLGNPSPLLYNGLLYVLSSRKGILSCFEPESGKLLYSERTEGVSDCWASPWAHEGKIYFTDSRGTTHVVKAGPQYKYLFENRLDNKMWSSVAAAGDSYILKGLNAMYCVRSEQTSNP